MPGLGDVDPGVESSVDGHLGDAGLIMLLLKSASSRSIDILKELHSRCAKLGKTNNIIVVVPFADKFARLNDVERTTLLQVDRQLSDKLMACEADNARLKAETADLRAARRANKLLLKEAEDDETAFTRIKIDLMILKEQLDDIYNIRKHFATTERYPLYQHSRLRILESSVKDLTDGPDGETGPRLKFYPINNGLFEDLIQESRPLTDKELEATGIPALRRVLVHNATSSHLGTLFAALDELGRVLVAIRMTLTATPAVLSEQAQETATAITERTEVLRAVDTALQNWKLGIKPIMDNLEEYELDYDEQIERNTSESLNHGKTEDSYSS